MTDLLFPARWRARAARWLPRIALLLLVPLFMWKLAFTNLILARGDTLLYFYPYWTYRAQALLAGRLPLWQPILFMGAPFLANSQAGVLYPFNWPLALFDAPTAVKLSTVFHVMLAAGGAYAFGRRGLRQSPLGALLSGALFALGGYATAQIEHVNQLQGLAWLPWLLLAAHALAQSGDAAAQGQLRSRRRSLSLVIGAAFIIALQILAGHTQTAFISLAGALLYAFLLSFLHRWRAPGTSVVRAAASPPVVWLLLAALLAVFLSTAQLLPTLELSGQSLRGGGLPLREALSFSLDPRLLGRALLPGYSRALFSEFTAYIGLVGLALAIAGLRRTPSRLALAGLALVGLLFSLGVYNPLYALLAALPPFDLFRVPARWLALFAFGAAQLAGSGLDELAALTVRRKLAMLLVPLLLIAAVPLANSLIVAGETGPLGPPALPDLLGWLAAILFLEVLLWLPGQRARRAPAIAALALAELAVAGWVLPYNHLTAPDVVTSVRPAMTQLLAAQSPPASASPVGSSLLVSSSLVTTVTALSGTPVAPRLSPAAPARFLSMSALRFDPGDLSELRAALDPQLPPDAVYDYLVATKHEEVQSPNLPLAWGLPAVDGYDGGILPLRHYAAFTQLFTGAASSDGRLRENLAAAPDPRLLSLVNARYLIADKVGDAWVDGVFYDLQFTLTLAAGESTQIAYVPPFQATALGLVADAFSGRVAFTYADGSQAEYRITSSRLRLDAPATPVTISLSGPLVLRGLSLVDERSGAFQTLSLGPYRLAHSGDVKVYENLAVLPRAFIASQAVVLSDADAQVALARADFDPAATVILAQPLPSSPAIALSGPPRPAAITAYTAEFVSLTADGPGYLLLTDAYYPGWTATLDGAPTAIQRADLMFRAVALPPGPHTIEFRYDPLSVRLGLWVSAVTFFVLGLLLAFLRRRA
ncbi:MAG: YfhO family protein [Anaerolineales bacterium]